MRWNVIVVIMCTLQIAFIILSQCTWWKVSSVSCEHSESIPRDEFCLLVVLLSIEYFSIAGTCRNSSAIFVFWAAKEMLFPLLELKIGHGGLLTAHIKFFPCQYQMQDVREKHTTFSDISEYSKSPAPASVNALLFCCMTTERFMAHILLNGLYRILCFKDT